MKHIDIYTDGSCRCNPGPGGWGAVLVYKGVEKEISGGDASTTNNRMELTAVIKALQALKEPCEIVLTSDSKYLVDAINQGWLESWKKRGWKKADKSPVLNVELWQKIDELLNIHKVTFVWVHGHQGHEYNERCDVLATTFADTFE
jgi:ribonuclease HI